MTAHLLMGSTSKIILGALGILLFIGILGGSSDSSQSQDVQGIQTYQESELPAEKETEYDTPTYPETYEEEPEVYYEETATEEEEYSPGLSNDNYYTNVDGEEVHSPAYTEDNSVPAGASAQCEDGTYSFSQNRRGTCSHHGGVASWL